MVRGKEALIYSLAVGDKGWLSGISGQDGGIGKHASPPCTTIAKNTATLQNTCHPELAEN